MKPNDRAVVRLTGRICTVEDGFLMIERRPGDYVHRIPVADVIATLPPVQAPGAFIWHDSHQVALEVVMHDEQAGAYVVRDAKGQLHVVPDNSDVAPVAADAAEAA